MRIDIRQFRGCLGGGDTGRPGRIPGFADSEGVSVRKTQGRLSENRQTRERIGIRRFRGSLDNGDIGQSSRESADQDENRYSAIQGVSGGAETWVGLVENRQNRENIDIP